MRWAGGGSEAVMWWGAGWLRERGVGGGERECGGAQLCVCGGGGRYGGRTGVTPP